MRQFSKEQLKSAPLPPVQKPAGRLRMLAAALKLFARQGFHGSSTRDLTSALEVQPSALYAHFASKEEVLAELIEIGYEAHHHALREAVVNGGATPQEQMAALVRANAKFHASFPLLAVVVHEEVHALTEERLKVANVFRAQSVGLLQQVIERGVAVGVFNPPDLQTTVAAIGAMSLRIPYWFQASAKFDLDALADAQVELALRMLTRARTRSP
ncbi:MAG: TetR/AcrR family transcriptional regulator [Archangium sp.]